MRILLICFILTLTTVAIFGGLCPRRCEGIKNEAYCAYDVKCNFHAVNKCKLQVEICWRRELHKPKFTRVEKGECPNDTPLCLDIRSRSFG